MANSPAFAAQMMRDKCMPNMANSPFGSLSFHPGSMESLFANSLQQSVNNSASTTPSSNAAAFNEALSMYLPGAGNHNTNSAISDGAKSHEVHNANHSKKENASSIAFSGMPANSNNSSKSNNSSNSSSSANNSKVESIVTCQSMSCL